MDHNMLAHIFRSEDGIIKEQTAAEHSYAASRFAAVSLKIVGLENAAAMAGLLHDMGKFRMAFREYLLAACRGEKVRRGSVNHSFAAVRFLLERYHSASPLDFDALAAELLAFAVGAHHGVFDCVAEDGTDGFLHRVEQDGLDYEEVLRCFSAQCADFDKLDAMFHKASAELETVLKRLHELARNNEEMSFFASLLARLLLSSVIEGDRRNTAEFMTGVKRIDAPEAMRGIWQDNLVYLERKLGELPQGSDIGRARQRFSDMAVTLADKPAGIYRLALPTGGGKTLTSLRVALAHAAQHNKRRIIFAIPLLSVLEQNADVLRRYIKDKDLILEHHSDLIREGEDEELNRLELLVENWSSPIIITTLVQLLNTLFDGRKSCIRRMHALCGSVLIIDEVQSVPVKLLSLFNLAVSFLASVCDTTVILCSATQPDVKKAAHPFVPEPENLVSYDPVLWKHFRRTKINPPLDLPLEEIGPWLREKQDGSFLLVCNTKAEAAAIYSQLEGTERYHLSTAMCMAHRRETFAKIKAAFKDDDGERSFICISTQLFEAGVDISFKVTARLLAGLDNIIQTAGRCNRHGEAGSLSSVHVIRCIGENLTHLPGIKAAKDAAEALFSAYQKDPSAFSDDPSSDAAVRFYYQKLFSNMSQGSQDGPLKGLPSLFELLSENEHFCGKCPDSARFWLRQAFAEAGFNFKVFEEENYDILVPYKDGKSIISDLLSEKAQKDLCYTSELLEKAKPYTVSIYAYQKAALEKAGALTTANGLLILADGWYDDELGLRMKGPSLDFMEV